MTSWSTQNRLRQCTQLPYAIALSCSSQGTVEVSRKKVHDFLTNPWETTIVRQILILKHGDRFAITDAYFPKALAMALATIPATVSYQAHRVPSASIETDDETMDVCFQSRIAYSGTSCVLATVCHPARGDPSPSIEKLNMLRQWTRAFSRRLLWL